MAAAIGARLPAKAKNKTSLAISRCMPVPEAYQSTDAESNGDKRIS
jgi:hypothetical protein